MINRKLLISFILFIFISQCCVGGTTIDSLKKLIDASSNDTSRINTLLSISKSYLNASPEEAIKYATQAKESAVKVRFQKGEALALKYIGIANYNQSKFIEALQAWQQALPVYSSINDRNGVANMYGNMGGIYNIQGDDAKALESHLKSMKVAESINDTFRILTSLINMGAVYANKTGNYDKALQNFERALALSEAIGDSDGIGIVTVNIGEIYLKRGNDTTALPYFERSLNAYPENSESIPYSLNNIGSLYELRGDYKSAIKYHQLAYDKAKILDAQLDMEQSLKGIAEANRKNGNIKLAILNYKQAKDIAIEIDANNDLKDIYEGLTEAYAELRDYGSAFKYQNLLLEIKDTLYSVSTDKKLSTLFFNFEQEKKQGKIDLLTKDKKIQEQEIKRQKIVRNGFIGGFAIVLLFAGVFFMQRNRISKEKKRSDELLLNILPEETAEELKATGTAKAKSFDLVSVLFTDFKNFTQASELLSAEELVQEINFCYSEFDRIITRHGIEKIKTIGDAYMCAGGLPASNTTHPFDVIKAGLEMTAFIEKNKQDRIAMNQPFFELRLGIHTGPVVAGIVGIKKFAYDIWGDTVNTASRMESSGEIGRVNISGATYEIVKDKFHCVHRGKVKAKNKGEIDMYFVEKIL